jgi:sulfite reductase beta subunit-like hemoprotein
MGITASMGAGRALRDTLLQMDVQDPLVKGMHDKISGCPNGCGRHHLASIGFQGAAIKGDGGNQVPSYEVYVGGMFEDGDFQYARRVVTKVPAKRAPEAMTRIIKFYEEQRQENEPFHQFVNRVGPPAFEPVLADLKGAGPVAENMDLYQDWERVGLYKLERGEGECAV